MRRGSEVEELEAALESIPVEQHDQEVQKLWRKWNSPIATQEMAADDSGLLSPMSPKQPTADD